MLEAFRLGGWGMYPTFVFGLVALGAALRFAVRTDPRLRGFIQSMARAVLFFAITGFVTGLIATQQYIASHGLKGGEALLTAFEGASESSNNLALGFTMLSLVHLATAVGRRRHDAKQPLEQVAAEASRA